MSIPQKSVEAKIVPPSGFLWFSTAMALVFFAASVGLAIWEDRYIPYSLVMAWVGFMLGSFVVVEEDRTKFRLRATILLVFFTAWYALSENLNLAGLVLAFFGLLLGLCSPYFLKDPPSQ